MAADAATSSGCSGDVLASTRSSADKLWVAQAPYLGMEHQTIIAYGSGFADNEYGFDELLLHEVAHEWWGNKITASDWADFWLHEGFASYAEALYVLDTLGEERYLDYMQHLRIRMSESRPRLSRGRISPATEAYSPDIYGKGAWVLHMLRFILGEEAMAEILWRFADGDNPETCRFATTQDFIDLVEEISDRGLDWFWQRYLFTAELPAWTDGPRWRPGDEFSGTTRGSRCRCRSRSVRSDGWSPCRAAGRSSSSEPGADATVDPDGEILDRMDRP